MRENSPEYIVEKAFSTNKLSLEGIARRMCNNDRLLEQEMLVRAMYTAIFKFEQLKNPNSINGWIARILTNEINQYYRELKKKKQPAIITVSDIDDPALNLSLVDMDSEDEDTLENKKYKEEVFKTIEDRVNLFTHIQQLIYKLKYVRGLKITEIANKLSIPEGTVKSETYKIIGKLRAAFNIKK